ncbi:bis-aminopropyl spermidine synthase family protein [Desulfothermobacter acidiphilus]|uniref:bis-aminopropyl spermidine synthase family protein n=1 Tax=Desulfothermobacter acidiphilus TaxID=1938353 RepID=UPI003F8CB80F
MEACAAELTRKTGIPISGADLRRVFSALKTSDEFWHITHLTGRPFNVVAESLRCFIERGWVKAENQRLTLTPAGERLAREQGVEPFIESGCQVCNRRGVSLDCWQGLLQRFRACASARPLPVINYDQGFVTEETTVARIAMMADRGDIQGKELLVLGDDDLVSLAAGLSGLPRRVVVLEVDERLSHFINTVAARENLPVEAHSFDLVHPLPSELRGSFDTFLTDPPETLEALSIFIGRGLAGLKGAGCAGYFGLTRTESSLTKWRAFQAKITGHFGVVITDIIHDFNEYVNWDYLLESVRDDLPFVQTWPRYNWYRSAMFRVETVDDRFFRLEEGMQGAPLYEDEEALIFTRRFRKE